MTLSVNTLRERSARQAFFYDAWTVLAFNGIDGDYVEFGCYGGMTFQLSYDEIRRYAHPAHLWAFDSFQGLPPPTTQDTHRQWSQGLLRMEQQEFHDRCAFNGIPPMAYTVVPGFYSETLPVTVLPQNIALAYIDCDLYSSTHDALEWLGPRLKHGMIIAFDDYWCWSATEASGEKRAFAHFHELYTRLGWTFSAYHSFGWHGQSFVVELVPAGYKQW